MNPNNEKLILEDVECVTSSHLNFKYPRNGSPFVVILKEQPMNQISDKATKPGLVYVMDKYGNFRQLSELLPDIAEVKICVQVPSWNYDEYIGSDEWRRRKSEYFQNNNCACSICGGINAIQLHHLSYKRLGYEDDSDLAPLCEDCHSLVHRYLDTYRERIGNLDAVWCNATRNISNANNDNALVERFISKYRDNLNYVFRDLPPIPNTRKMKFLSVFRNTVIGQSRNDVCLPFNMIAKVVNAQKG